MTVCPGVMLFHFAGEVGLPIDPPPLLQLQLYRNAAGTRDTVQHNVDRLFAGANCIGGLVDVWWLAFAALLPPLRRLFEC